MDDECREERIQNLCSVYAFNKAQHEHEMSIIRNTLKINDRLWRYYCPLVDDVLQIYAKYKQPRL